MSKAGKYVIYSVLVLMILVMTGGSLFAEEPDLITDRPDFTESANAVPNGSWQFEMGYTFAKDKPLTDHTIGELLVRFAVIENFEFRAGVNSYHVAKIGGNSYKGLDDMSLGVKWALVPGTLAVIASTSVPTGAKVFRTSKLQPGLTVSLAKDLSETVSLGSNLGVTSLY